MSRPRIAILASGSGTTAETFIKLSAESKIKPEVGLVIGSRRDAGIFERVRRLNQTYNLSIELLYIGKKNYPPEASEQLLPGSQTKAEEQAILEALEAGSFDLIALMGYMKKVGSTLVKRFGWQPEYSSPYQAMMLNTHPGLLPDTKGLYGIYVQEYVLQHSRQQAGQTLHVVAEQYDDGPTIAEHRIAVDPSESPDELFDRVKAAEKQYVPYDIERFIEERRKYKENQ